MLRNVNHNGSHFEDRCIVGLKSTLGAVQGLWLGNVALYHRSETQRRHNDQPNWNLSFFFSFMWWRDLDGCKTVKHHANPLFRVQVSTQNSDTMNELQWFFHDRWIKGLLVCKKYFRLCLLKIFSAFLLKCLTQILSLHQTVITYRTEREREMRFIINIFGIWDWQE